MFINVISEISLETKRRREYYKISLNSVAIQKSGRSYKKEIEKRLLLNQLLKNC